MRLLFIALALALATCLHAKVEFLDNFETATVSARKVDKRLFIYFAPTFKAQNPDVPPPEDPLKALWDDRFFSEHLGRTCLALRLELETNKAKAETYGVAWAPMFVLLDRNQREFVTVYGLSEHPSRVRKWLDQCDVYLRTMPGMRERATRQPKDFRLQNELASFHAEHAQYARAAAVYEAFLAVAADKTERAVAKCQLATVLAAQTDLRPVAAQSNSEAFRYYSESVDEFIELKDKRALDAAVMAAPLDDGGARGENIRKLLFAAAKAFPDDPYEGEVRIKAALVAGRYGNYDAARAELRAMLDQMKYAALKRDVVDVLAMIEVWERRKK